MEEEDPGVPLVEFTGLLLQVILEDEVEEAQLHRDHTACNHTNKHTRTDQYLRLILNTLPASTRTNTHIPISYGG